MGSMEACPMTPQHSQSPKHGGKHCSSGSRSLTWPRLDTKRSQMDILKVWEPVHAGSLDAKQRAG